MGAFHSEKTATIALNAATSSAVYCGDKLPVAIRFPGTMTGATVTFTGSQDGVTYQQVFADDAAYTEAVDVGKDVVLRAVLFSGYRYIKIVSASNEAAARSLTVLTRRCAAVRDAFAVA